MEAAKSFAGNGSLESSPPAVLPSPDDDGQEIDVATSDDNKELDATSPVTTPEKIPNPSPPSSSSLTETQNNNNGDDDGDNHLSESHTEPEPKNAAAQPTIEPFDEKAAHPFETSAEPSRNQTDRNHPEARIVARLSSPENDDFVAPPPLDRTKSSPDENLLSSSAAADPKHRRLASMDQIVAKVAQTHLTRAQSTKPNKASTMHSIDLTRGQIDTAAPFESVKAAVSKFGGIVDWKAHRVQTVERRKYIGQELEKAQEEIPIYKQQSETAEAAKMQVLKDLDATKAQIEELKLKLETAQKDEERAKQTAELAKLEVEKMEPGISDEATSKARAQLELARVKHAAAVAELNAANSELDQIRKDSNSALAEKENCIRNTEEANTASKEAEKSIDEMTAEILTLKQSLQSVRSEHLDKENRIIVEVTVKELECLIWESELSSVEEKLGKLNSEMASTKDVRSKLGEATALLQHMKAEMAKYMESKSGETGEDVTLEGVLTEPKMRSHNGITAAITVAKIELTEARQNIETTADKVESLKVSETSLKSALDEERSELAAIKQRERIASNEIRCLEANLSSVKSELTIVKQCGEQEATKDLPKQLQQAAREADEAKTLAQTAHCELQKATKEAEHAKAGAKEMASRLQAARIEIETARASENLAIAAIKALAKNESAQRDSNDNSPDEVMLTLGEYYELTKKVHEAEVEANTRMAAAVSQVEAAKESASMSLNRLEEVNREIAERKETLALALLKAEKAEAEKLAAEEELRKLKSEHEQKNMVVKPVLAPVKAVSAPLSPRFDEPRYIFGPPSCLGLHKRSKTCLVRTSTRRKTENTESPTELTLSPRKKKRSFLPRFFMSLFKKKTQVSSKTA
ncbi:protein WEAK CHLOROPLAST MOVEMENT UNDER BLUE LIGHT 1-like [Andrographis paniculata]|uniref:protein WEAK CHLOROPLAST MOVEMENT UNDER BLUE LIGHT 1-like n=1 Tax=Andrographis paniculata TaxID=175694 RepID=UPI0021E7BD48|nr:protein WEAK CHLOROPLAST MOVEMENT UNDER BLUE LIGHT 1-like [Andrographis paniculata]